MSLIDPPQALYYVLAAALVVSGVIAAQKQDRRAATAFGGAFLLVAVVFLIDKLNKSPREQAVRRVFLMQMAVDAKTPDAFVEHCADKVTVHTANGKQVVTREQLRTGGFWAHLRFLDVKARVWDFAREDAKEIDENEIEIGFLGKGDASGKPFPFYGRATFRRQNDGQFKLSEFKSFNPVNRNEPLALPHFP